MKKFITLALAICMALSASVFASAAEVNSDGGSGSTPVYLSSTEDGTLDGDPSATAMSVTVPTALPMAMSQTGDVTTADNCRIVNNSYGAVRVKSVTITAENGWKLYKSPPLDHVHGRNRPPSRSGRPVHITVKTPW